MRDSPLAPNDLRLRAAVRWRWFETLLLTTAVPAGRFAAGSADPFAVGGPFPWLVFVPLAIGLQHGLGCAAASFAAIAGGAVVHAGWAGVPLPPASLGFACGAIALVASRACDAQRERCERLRSRVVQLELAWERERRARAVSRLSHDRWAEQSAGALGSFEDALSSVAPRVAAARGVSEFGRLVLDLLVQQAELQEGSVWLESRGRCVQVATTKRGAGGPPSMSPLVRRAMRKRRVVSLLEELFQDSNPDAEGVLAAMPLFAADGTLRGALLVEQMPFECFGAGELQRMSVLLSAVVAPVESGTWDRWVAELAQGVPSARDTSDDAAAGGGRWDAIA